MNEKLKANAMIAPVDALMLYSKCAFSSVWCVGTYAVTCTHVGVTQRNKHLQTLCLFNDVIVVFIDILLQLRFVFCCLYL